MLTLDMFRTIRASGFITAHIDEHMDMGMVAKYTVEP
jgi:hypothetical protein